MGNTVSAAEAVAAGITHTPNQHGLIPDHSKFDTKTGTPPPECPMHQKMAPPPSASECPVIDTTKDQINPYNMVFHSIITIEMMNLIFKEKRDAIVLKLNILDATSKSKSSTRSTISIANNTTNINHTKSD